MSNIVSFAGFKNDRRALAEIADREAARAKRDQRERDELAERLGGTAGAQIIADVVADLREAERAAGAPQFMPAYCDPKNEVRGSKFEATRDLNPREVAARIRADIKAAQKAGTVNPGAKISVRMDSYSGGWSVDVRVTDLPAGFRVASLAYASWRKQFGDRKDPPMHWLDCRSQELRDLLAALQSIHAAYNRDNSDSSVDYFDTRFHGSVEVDWRLRDRLEREEIAASAGDYWAEDAGR